MRTFDQEQSTFGYALLLYIVMVVALITLIPFEFRIPDKIQISWATDTEDFFPTLFCFCRWDLFSGSAVEQTKIGLVYALSDLSSASVAVVSSAGMDGGNGGWPVLYGQNPVTSSNLNLAIDEDQLKDSERSHTTEQVSYAIFE